MSDEVEDFLEHFGVKGMKWGVRKERESGEAESSDGESKKYTGLSKKQIAIGGAVVVGVAATAVILANSGNIQTALLERGERQANISLYKRTHAMDFFAEHGDSKEMSFPQGAVFGRISKVAETEVRQGAYVNHTPKDILKYQATWENLNNRNDVKIEALKDIKVASAKARIDNMIEMVDSPLSDPKYNGKTLRQLRVDQQDTLLAKAWVKRIDPKRLAEREYNEITGDNWGKGLGKEYADRLIAKGYDAMPDDRDGRSGLSDSPLVLLNKAAYKVASSHKMSKEEIDTAYSKYKTTYGSLY